jgi:hypothetical protein
MFSSMPPRLVVREQLVKVPDHRGTRARRADNGFCGFKDLNEPFGEFAGLVSITGIECWLTAARLTLVKINLTAGLSQHVDRAHSDIWTKLINETCNE